MEAIFASVCLSNFSCTNVRTYQHVYLLFSHSCIPCASCIMRVEKREWFLQYVSKSNLEGRDSIQVHQGDSTQALDKVLLVNTANWNSYEVSLWIGLVISLERKVNLENKKSRFICTDKIELRSRIGFTGYFCLSRKRGLICSLCSSANWNYHELFKFLDWLAIFHQKRYWICHFENVQSHEECDFLWNLCKIFQVYLLLFNVRHILLL